VAVRVAEAAGVGLLVGSGLAILLGALLVGLGRPATAAVVWVMAAGACLGTSVGVGRRPVLMMSAVRADGQLGLADLLSTALAVEAQSPREPWADVVLSTANARCAGLAPSAVLLRRFSGRVWGGIAVAVLLALTIAVFSAGSASVLAVGSPSNSNPRSGYGANLPPLPIAEPAPNHSSAAARRRTWADPEESRKSMGDVTAPADAGPADAMNVSKGMERVAGGSDSFGPGAASSGKTAPSSPPQVSPPPSATSAGVTNAEAAATAGGGNGLAARVAGAAGERSSSSTGSAPTSAPPAAPWKSAAWPGDVTAALQAIDAGRVPAGYRDIVNDYFDRP
jgi:hypothetical protein